MHSKLKAFRSRLPFLLLTIILFPIQAFALGKVPVSGSPDTDQEIVLYSSAFQEGDDIPAKFTCDGKDNSPPLRWKNKISKVQSFALVMQDPDALRGNWVHWILFDIPPTVDYLPGGLPPIAALANAERHGTNDFKKLGYGGPCPPEGKHRYFFTLYALDTMLHLDSGISLEQLQKAMEGHVLGEGKLMGRYQRSK